MGKIEFKKPTVGDVYHFYHDFNIKCSVIYFLHSKKSNLNSAAPTSTVHAPSPRHSSRQSILEM